MTRRPTKLEMAQHHAIYAPAGKLRDEADKQLEIETEKRLKRRENKKLNPTESETHFMSRIMKDYKNYTRSVYEAGTIWLARNNNGTLIKRFVDYFSFGLGSGTSDYVGGKCIVVTSEMVGRKLCVLMVVEGKLTMNDEPDERQARFIDAVRSMGGIALVVDAEQENEARRLIAEAMP